ncbi:MAG: hypothetical protein K0Q55_2315 [Verrucomicrobia bacterium]|jgi:hypothetical protein|nr:hypothetical protein [Verrucomicrobiota bacterium]
MKRIFTSTNSAEVGLLKSRLEEAGIECEIRNEFAAQALPGTAFDPELWVLDDAQYAEAKGLLEAWQHPVAPE